MERQEKKSSSLQANERQSRTPEDFPRPEKFTLFLVQVQGLLSGVSGGTFFPPLLVLFLLCFFGRLSDIFHMFHIIGVGCGGKSRFQCAIMTGHPNVCAKTRRSNTNDFRWLRLAVQKPTLLDSHGHKRYYIILEFFMLLLFSASFFVCFEHHRKKRTILSDFWVLHRLVEL